MIKKPFHILILLLIAAFLAACSGAKATSETTAADPTAQSPAGSGPAGTSIEMKLAVGTLKLEDTDLAVTADQAADLLPLWKAVKSLSASDTATQAEIQALYEQIQETMTSEQVQAIEAMEFGTDDLSALMEELGIDPGSFAGAGPGGMQNLSEEERATRVAQFQAQNPGFEGRGMGGDPGFVPPDGGAGFLGAGAVQGTPNPTRMGSRRSLGLNMLFVDPLIELLQERAGEGLT